MSRLLPTFVAVLGALAVAASFACASATPPPLPGARSNLTPAMVKRTLDQGVTTQNAVIAQFGAPNIITTDESGREVWTYDVHSVSSSAATTSSSASGGVGAGGLVSGSVPVVGGVGGSAGGSTSAGQVSSSTFTLMITFDERQVVETYRMQATQF